MYCHFIHSMARLPMVLALVVGSLSSAVSAGVAQAVPPADCKPFALQCSGLGVSLPFALTFNGSEGGLLDADGEQVGFSMIQPPSNVAATGAIGDLATNRNLVGGQLLITTTKGIQYRTPATTTNANSLDNALGVGLSAAGQSLRITTTISGPPVGSNTAEQAGLWFGLDEDTYAKLVIYSTGSGYRVQLAREISGASVVSDEVNTANNIITNPLSHTIRLTLQADAGTATIAGFYSLDGGADQRIGALSVPAPLFSGVDYDSLASTPPLSFAGIYASHRNRAATAVPASLIYRFDSFGISATPLDLPPAAPSNLAAASGNGQVVLSWDANTESDLRGYNVFRGLSLPVATGGTPLNGATPLAVSSFSDSGLINGSTYYYVVEAVDTAGNKAAAGPVSAKPQAPASTFSAKINFQPATRDGLPLPAPTGYLSDTGAAYSNQRGFGWVTQASLAGTHEPLDLSANTRVRARPGIDPRLDSLIYLQGGDALSFSGVITPAAWEYALPNGTYGVTVSVGDQPDGAAYDSQHAINVEGVAAISLFQPSATQEYTYSTVQVAVVDGKLTLDALGGSNTRLNYVEIAAASAISSRPTVTGTTPADGTTGISRDTFVAATVSLPNSGQGVNAATLTAANVRLLRTSDGQVVSANLNTSGGGDVIVLQPTALLAANTQYTFQVTADVKDTSGESFFPFSMSFTTGTGGGSSDGPVGFDKVQLPSSEGKPYTRLVIGPDGKLYAGTLQGEILRFAIGADGTLGAPQVISSLQTYSGSSTPRALIGMAFDPAASAANLILWVTHGGAQLTSGAPNWSGKLSRLSGPNLEAVQDVVINFPRSDKDHMTNGIAFRPGEPSKIYINQGSQSAMGAPDNAWGQRPEELLSAAVLQLDLTRLPATLPLDVKTGAGGSYNPYAPGAPLTLYATGVRNAYDLVWHSNGQLYVPTNGSAAGGNVPGLPADYASLPQCLNRSDSQLAGTYSYTGTAPVALTNVPQTQKDWLFRVVQGGYYGHPNPLRCEWVLGGGNPTTGSDPAQVSQYPVGTQPDRNYRGASYDFDLNKSPNGAIEYRSDSFGGALKGRLLVVRYSAGDDIIALTPGGPNLDIVGAQTGITGFTGFNDPLDLTEETGSGNLYVAELSGQKITLLRPRSASVGTPKIATGPSRLVFTDVADGVAGPTQTLTISNTGSAALLISGLSLGGTDAAQFLLDAPALPAAILPGLSLNVGLAFSPTAPGPRGAILQIASNDPDTPSASVALRGLGTAGLGGTSEPSLQWVLDALQLPLSVGDDNPADSIIHSSQFAAPLRGDETPAQLFVKAGSGPVSVEPLAAFGPQGSDGMTLRFGWYGAGNRAAKSQLFSLPNSASQTLLPTVVGSLSFDPGANSFGLYSVWPYFASREVFGEDALNSWETTPANRHKLRIFALKDAAGLAVPNAYLVATEEHTSGFDYQDVVVIVRNVRPATAASAAPSKAEIEVQGLDGVPFADYLVFSRIQTPETGTRLKVDGTCCVPANSVHDSATLRVWNSGVEPLNISGLTIDKPNIWVFSTTVALPTAIAPGAFFDLPLKFVAQSELGSAAGLFTGTLTIASDDVDEPLLAVALAGFWQSVSENNQEPNVSEIARLFGYTTAIVYAGQSVNTRGRISATGEEVLSPYWRRADETRPVIVRQLAAYHRQGDPASFYWHTKPVTTATSNSGVFTHLGLDGQTVLPRKDNNLSLLAAGSFSPPAGAIFGFKVDGEWGDPSRNTKTPDDCSRDAAYGQNTCGQHLRVWPARDRSGVIMPNTYLVSMDYAGINYDFNDNLYLVSNIKPEVATLDLSATAPVPGAASLVLDFDRVYTGTLADRDGQPTGFLSTQRNRDDLISATRSYSSALIDLDTGLGTLAISTTEGLNLGSNTTLTNNLQVNALQLHFDGSSTPFSIGARLLGPLNGLNDDQQQAGIFFGPDQDNYVKLVVGRPDNNSGNGTPAIRFAVEQNTQSSNQGSAVSLGNAASIQSLDLFLVGDPGAGTLRAAYRVDGGVLVTLPTTLTLSALQRGRFFATQARGGVLTSHRNAASALRMVFDRFAVTASNPAGTLPAPRQALYRLDVGASSAYTDSLGNRWSPDSGYFTPASAIAEGNTADPIAGTSDALLYQTYRGNLGSATPVSQRVLTYTLPLRGLKQVDLRLHFAERFHSTPDARLFDVEAEGLPLRSGMDIFTAAGGKNTATVLQINNVAVPDGILNLAFRAVKDYAAINAIEVLCQGACPTADAVPPAAPTGLTAALSGARVTIDWADSPESDLAGYNIYRATSTAGPFTKLNSAPVGVSAYSDASLPAVPTVYYSVTAVDLDGNESPATPQVNVTLPLGNGFLEQGGQVAIEAESYALTFVRNGKSWLAQTDKPGYAGQSFMLAQPDTGTVNSTDYLTKAPELQFPVVFSTTGTYYLWLRMQAVSANDDSIHGGIDGQATSSADRIMVGSTLNAWVWTRSTLDGPPATLSVTTPGLRIVNIWMREDGARLDKLILTTNSSFVPSGVGPNESARGSSIAPTPTSTTPTPTTPTVTATPTTPTPTPTVTATPTTPTPTPTTPTLTPTASATASATGTVTATSTPTVTATSTTPTAITTPTATGTVAAGGFREQGGQVAIEAESYTLTISRGSQTWAAKSDKAGYSGASFMIAQPNSGIRNDTGYTTKSPELQYPIIFDTPGTYYVWLRMYANGAADDSVHVGIDGQALASADRMTVGDTVTNSWQWTSSTVDGVVATVVVTTPGLHTLNLWMREDGARVDKIFLSTSAVYTPSGIGPAESLRN